MHGCRFLNAPERKFHAALDRLGNTVAKGLHWQRRYGGAAALVGVALVIRMLIGPLDAGIQYVTFFPAVALAAVIGGFWPGILAAVLATTLGTVLFWPPYAALDFAFDGHMVLSNTVFMLDTCIVCAAIEALHRAHHRLTASEHGRRMAAMVCREAADGVVVTDARGIILAVNPAFTNITGYNADEALGRSAAMLGSGLHARPFFNAMWLRLQGEGAWSGDMWNRRKNGAAYLQSMHIECIDDAPTRSRRYVAVFQDIHDATRGTHHENKATPRGHRLCRDPLTALPNSALLQDRLDLAMARARRLRQSLTLALFNIDGFNAVNKAMGYDIGDRLLQEVAERLQSNLRSSDTVARLEGDLFAVLLENMMKTKDWQTPIVHQLATIAQPMALAGHAIRVTATAGFAIFPIDARESRELMHHARAALDAARAGQRGSFRRYDAIRHETRAT